MKKARKESQGGGGGAGEESGGRSSSRIAAYLRGLKVELGAKKGGKQEKKGVSPNQKKGGGDSGGARLKSKRGRISRHRGTFCAQGANRKRAWKQLRGECRKKNGGGGKKKKCIP